MSIVFDGRGGRLVARAYDAPSMKHLLQVWLYNEAQTGMVAPVELGPMPEPNAHALPSFELTREMAQQLMDDLWVAGLRPTEGTGSAGSLAATERHLEDMRAIVAKKLEVTLPDKGRR